MNQAKMFRTAFHLKNQLAPFCPAAFNYRDVKLFSICGKALRKITEPKFEHGDEFCVHRTIESTATTAQNASAVTIKRQLEIWRIVATSIQIFTLFRERTVLPLPLHRFICCVLGLNRRCSGNFACTIRSMGCRETTNTC